MDDVGVLGRNGIRDGFVTVIGTPHGDPLISGFVKLQRTEGRLKE